MSADQPLAPRVFDDLCSHPESRAGAVARRLGVPLVDVYGALVHLHDRGLARITNTKCAWQRKTGRARLWSAS